MSTWKISMAALALAMGLSGVAHAALHDRGGGLIYDDVLDITWLADANYAHTSGYSLTLPSAYWEAGYDSGGAMYGGQAAAWAEQLVYGGYDDWRLPTNNPVHDIAYDLGYNLTHSYNYAPSFDGSTDVGYNITSPKSEMAYMYYVNLGNPGSFTMAGEFTGCQQGYVSCRVNTGPFINLGSTYWSGTRTYRYYGDPDAFTFSMGDGYQGTHDTGYPVASAWAVRDGDVVAVPEPETYAMFLAGCGLVGFAARRRAK